MKTKIINKALFIRASSLLK